MENRYALMLMARGGKRFEITATYPSEDEAIDCAPHNRRFQIARITSGEGRCDVVLLRTVTPFQTTDPDCGQRCRIHTFPDGHREYEYSQETSAGSFYTETIRVDTMTEQEMKDAISGYYPSIDNVKEIYGDNWEQIIAECAFEQSLI